MRPTRRAPTRRAAVTPTQMAVLTDSWRPDEPVPAGRDDIDPAEPFLWGTGSLLTLRAAWDASRDDIVPTWTVDLPGTRPAAWWQFEAPGPRLRVGGTGDRLSDVLAHAPALEYGVPVAWLDAETAALYKAQFGTELRDRVARRPAVPVDPLDPPFFESQAAFLERHGLLSAAERDALSPLAFEPEAAMDEDEDESEPWRG